MAERKISEYKATFPVVEYSYESIADPIRRAKSKKYGRVPMIDPNIGENSREVSITNWEVGLSALPIDKSQLIAVGKVVDAKSYLSDNKASVYSEFSIELERVFKNETSNNKKATRVLAERQGGVVRFASGFEKWIFVEGQGMPLIGEKYLFFLTNDFPGNLNQKDDLHILTAYKLKDGRIFPLDNPGGGTHPIAKDYLDKQTSVLFDDLSKSLHNSRKSKKDVIR